MRRFMLMLATCSAGALVSTAAANATVIFDSVSIESFASAQVNGTSKQDDPSKTFTSLANVKNGVERVATASVSKAAGTAEATSDNGALFASKRRGVLILDESVDTDTFKANANASASAAGSVGYTFDLTGPRLYDVTVTGGAIAPEGDFLIELVNVATSDVLFSSGSLNPGQSLVWGGLANGQYELKIDNGFPSPPGLSASTSGLGGSSDGDLFGSIDFRIAAIPEPGAWALMGFGLFAVGAMARRARRLQAQPTPA